MKISVNKMVKLAILSALAYVLMLLAFSLPFFPPFLQIDISEIPVLLAGFTMGPVAAIIVELVKNLLHLFNTYSLGVGELANFIVGIAFVVPAAIIYKMRKCRLYAIIGLLSGIILMAVVASVANYFVMIPFYANLFHMPLEGVIKFGTDVNGSIVDLKTMILFGIVPFNLLKGSVVSLILMLIYKKLSPILRKEDFRKHTN